MSEQIPNDALPFLAGCKHDGPFPEEEWFRHLAEHIRDVFWVTSGDGNRAIYISPSYEEVWGRPREELYRDFPSFTSTVHPDDVARLHTYGDEILHLPAEEQERQGREGTEFRIVRPDGTVRWIRARSFPLRDTNGTVQRFVGLSEDVTTQK